MFWWAPQDAHHYFYIFLKEGRFGRSRSSKVIDIGANRKRICDFLLVRNSYFGHLAPFRRYDRFYVLLTPPLFNPNFEGVPVAPDRPCWASTSTWTLSYWAVKLFSKNSNIFEHAVPDRYRQADRQTDRQTDGRTDDMQSHNRALR